MDPPSELEEPAQDTDTEQPGLTPEKTARTALSHRQFTKRLVTAVGIVTAVALLLVLVWFSVGVWLVVFAGILLAIFLRGLADWVSARTRLAPGWALAVVVVMLLALGALVGWFLAPNAIEQFHELAARLPTAIEQLKQRLQGLGWVRYLVEKLPSTSDLGAGSGKLFAKLGGFFSGGSEVVTGFVLILFLGLYLGAAPEVYVSGILYLFPIPKRVRVREVLGEVGATLRNWLLGQLLSMVVVGILIGVGLQLLGIPLPWRWAFWRASLILFPSSALCFPPSLPSCWPF